MSNADGDCKKQLLQKENKYIFTLSVILSLSGER